MTALARPALAQLGRVLGGAGTALAALAAATAAAALVPVVAQAWLFVFLVAIAAPVGATALLMIATLTGGRWGDAWRPVLAPLAAWTVAVALCFLPVAVSLPALYPWAADPGAAPPGVAALYLNAPFFLVRACLALAGWSALGLAFGLGRPGPLPAALGLVFHAVAVSLVSTDWFLSREPGYASSDFGALTAVAQLGTAAALVALLGRERDGRRSDIGSLLLATQAGTLYLGLMAFVIAWYGDLPATIGWYVRRGEGPWPAVVGAAVALGTVVPLAILFGRTGRSGGPALRVAGFAALAGLALHAVWLVGPAPSGAGAAGAGAVGAGGVLALAAVALAAVATRIHARETADDR